ncbi:MAG: hypothetical protein QG635_288 [Bacteroidota bacterium]|nr:hypothetical protein [Bacteroidota bacterium]
MAEISGILKKNIRIYLAIAIIIPLVSISSYAVRPAACSFFYTGQKDIIYIFSINSTAINYSSTDMGPAYVDSPQNANVEAGNTYSFSIRGGYESGNYNDTYFRIFIDINKDGDFTDTDEMLYSAFGNFDSEIFNNSITIPSLMNSGEYRMRVTNGQLQSTGVTTGCGDGGYGSQAVDFGIFIVDPITLVSIDNPTSSNEFVYCAGGAIAVTFTANMTFNGGNVFTAQLSDASGNFSSPYSLGTLNATSGTNLLISGAMPSTTGSGYRVRIRSSNPVEDSEENDDDITINPLPTPGISGQTAACVNDPVTYSETTTASTRLWKVTGGVIIGASNNSSVNLRWNTPGTQYVRLIHTNSSGCTDSTTINVTVNPLPNPAINGSTSVCPGEQLQYSTPTEGGAAYSWSISGGTINGSPNNSNIDVTWGNAGPGSLTLLKTFSATGCDSTNIMNITINPKPTAQIIGNTAICANVIENYSAQTAETTNLWTITNGTVIGSSVSSSIRIKWGTIDGSLKLLQINNNGCRDSSSINITINASPVPEVNGSAASCEGNFNDYSVTTPGNTNNKWSVSGGGSINGADNLTSANILWLKTGSQRTEKVMIEQTNNITSCKGYDTLLVIVNPLPKPVSILGNEKPAQSSTEEYSPENNPANHTNMWFVKGNGSVQGASIGNKVTINWGNPGSGTITLVQTNNVTLCRDSVFLVVTIQPNTIPTISGPDSVCINGISTYTTTSNPNITKKWSVIGSGSIIGKDDSSIVVVQWGGVEGTGSVLLHTVEQGSPKDTNKSVKIIDIPKPAISGSNSVNANSAENYSTTPGTGISSEWLVTNGVISGTSTANSVQISWGMESSGSIRLIHKNSIGCSDTAFLDVSINLPDFRIDGKSSICPQVSEIYTTPVKAGEESLYSFTWTAAGGTIQPPAAGTTVTINWGDIAGIFTIQLIRTTIQNNNKDTATKDITIYPLPKVDLGPYNTYCTNDKDFTLNGAPPSGTYTGTGFKPSNIFSPSEAGAGNHLIIYTYQDPGTGCTNSSQVNILVFDSPVKPVISQSSDGQHLISSSTFENTWFENGIESNAGDKNSQTFTPLAKGNFTVKAKNANGCESEMSDNFPYDPGNLYSPKISITDSIVFNYPLCSQPPNICRTVYIKNIGVDDLILSGIPQISGVNSGDFSVNCTLSIIAGGDSLRMDVCFAPQDTGSRSAVLTINSNASNNPAYAIDLSGKKDIVDFTLSKTNLSFLHLVKNTQYAKRITITNTGTIPINWLSPINIGRFTLTVIPNTTPPSGSSVLTVRFSGGNAGETENQNVEVITDTCTISKFIDLNAQVNSDNEFANITIGTANVDANVGDIFELPVYVMNAQFLGPVDETKFSIELTYNASLLDPMTSMGTPSGTILPGDIRQIPLEVTVPSNPESADLPQTLIAKYFFRATLGNDTATWLRLSDISVPFPGLKLDSSLFKLKNICYQGGARLVSSNGQIAISLAKPNPTGDFCQLEIEVIEKGRTQIYIATPAGIIAQDVFDGNLSIGKHTLELDLRELSAGMYFVVLQTPTDRKTLKVSVMR